MASCRRLAYAPGLLVSVFCLFTYCLLSRRFCIIVFSSHLPRSQSACSHVPVWVRVDANTFLHLFFSLMPFRGGPCVMQRVLLPCCLPICTILHLFLFPARSLLPVTPYVSCPPLISSHTPRIPSPDLRHRHPPPTSDTSHRLIPEPSHFATSLAFTALLSHRHRSMPPISTLSPFPYAFSRRSFWCNTSPYHYWDRVLALVM